MRKQQTVAFISIGQSPRTDITKDFLDVWDRKFSILDIGALDELSLEEIHSLAPVAGEADLITKLRDGQVVYLSHDRLMPQMEKAIAKAAKCGADWAVVACTGDFSRLNSEIPLLLSNQILEHSVASLLRTGDKLAVIVPTAGQAGEAAERWTKRGFAIAKVIVQNPFENHQAVFEQLADDPAVQSTKGLIADCFGFGTQFEKAAANFYAQPVFVARTLIAHLLLATR